jgi:hypothetical protein
VSATKGRLRTFCIYSRPNLGTSIANQVPSQDRCSLVAQVPWFFGQQWRQERVKLCSVACCAVGVVDSFRVAVPHTSSCIKICHNCRQCGMQNEHDHADRRLHQVQQHRMGNDDPRRGGNVIRIAPLQLQRLHCIETLLGKLPFSIAPPEDVVPSKGMRRLET